MAEGAIRYQQGQFLPNITDNGTDECRGSENHTDIIPKPIKGNFTNACLKNTGTAY